MKKQFENLNAHYAQMATPAQERVWKIKRFLKSLLWRVPMGLAVIGVAYIVGTRADALWFALVHTDQVRTRAIQYNNAIASGSAAVQSRLDYLDGK